MDETKRVDLAERVVTLLGNVESAREGVRTGMVGIAGISPLGTVTSGLLGLIESTFESVQDLSQIVAELVAELGSSGGET